MSGYYQEPVSWTTPATLAASTTYFFRLRAINAYGYYSAFDQVFSTPTLLPAPSTMTATEISTQAVTWMWAPLLGVTTYEMRLTSGPLLGIVQSTSMAHLNLNPGSLSSVKVAGIDFLKRRGDFRSNQTYTLVNPASGTHINDVGSLSVRLAWGGNGNVAGNARYQIESSTVVDFSSPVSTFTNISANVYDVPALPMTTYYFRVRAYNLNGIYADYDQTVSTRTRIAPPENIGATVLGVSSVAWSWSAVPTAVSYNVYRYVSGSYSLLGNTVGLSYTQTGLLPNESSTVTVSAIENGGLEGSVSTNTKSVYTWVNPPVGSMVRRVGSSSIQLLWSTNGNNTAIYDASYSPFSDFSASVGTVTVVSTNTATISGLWGAFVRVTTSSAGCPCGPP
jgi:hypothetical protein